MLAAAAAADADAGRAGVDNAIATKQRVSAAAAWLTMKAFATPLGHFTPCHSLFRQAHPQFRTLG